MTTAGSGTGTMEHRNLGTSDLGVSVVGLGTNNFGRRLDRDATAEVVRAALDAGINFFDTSNTYGEGDSERFLGAALGSRRGETIVATKFGMQMPDEPKDLSRGRRDYILKALDESLARLSTDYVDLYQLHLPDPTTPVEETLGVLDELVSAGKVRAIGCSNVTADQVREADGVARQHGLARFVTVQNQYSLLRREVEAEVVPAALELQLSLIPYFPLASGLLTGKYRRDSPPPPGTRLSTSPNGATFLNEENLAVVESLDEFARSRGVSVLELAIGGLAAMPAVASVIAGAMSPEQVRRNAAAGQWRPSADDLDAIRRLSQA